MTRFNPASRHDKSARSGVEAALLAKVLAALVGEEVAVLGADRLIMRFGDLGACVAAPEAEVRLVLGPDADLCLPFLVDLHSLWLASLRSPVAARPIIGGMTALKRYLRAALGHESREQMRVLFLDRRNRLIVEEITGTGTLDHAPVYPREIVRRALELGAAGMILVHNHPSGDGRPSEEDIRVTDQVVAGCDVFGIEVHDHIVVGRHSTFSFHANAMIRSAAFCRKAGPWRRLPPVKRSSLVHETPA